MIRNPKAPAKCEVYTRRECGRESDRERETMRETEGYAEEGECVEDIDAMWGNKSRRENV